MDGTRLQKVSRLIQKDLSEIIQFESNNLFEGAMITITKVKISADLSIARINVSILPLRGKTIEEIFTLLKDKKTYIRMKLAQKVRNQLRIIPEISFYIDDSLDYIENIEKLLKE